MILFSLGVSFVEETKFVDLLYVIACTATERNLTDGRYTVSQSIFDRNNTG